MGQCHSKLAWRKTGIPGEVATERTRRVGGASVTVCMHAGVEIIQRKDKGGGGGGEERIKITSHLQAPSCQGRWERLRSEPPIYAAAHCSTRPPQPGGRSRQSGGVWQDLAAGVGKEGRGGEKKISNCLSLPFGSLHAQRWITVPLINPHLPSC